MSTEAPAAPAVEVTVTEAPVVALSAEDEARAEAEFGAGFKTAHGEEPHAESRPVKTEPTKAEPEKPVVEAPAKAVPEDKVIFEGWTESQLKTALAKVGEVDDLKKQIAANHDKAFGRFGELQAALKAVTQSPSGQPVKVTKEVLKRLNADGYGELADALAEDLNGLVLAAGAGTDQAALVSAMEAKVGTRLDELNRATEQKLLTIAHRDWRAVYASDDFKTWRTTLPAEAQAVLDTSWDSTVLSDALDDFKAWKAKAEAEKTTKAQAAVKAAATTKAQDKRLEAAIAPKTDGKPASGISDDEAFDAGFKEARHAG